MSVMSSLRRSVYGVPPSYELSRMRPYEKRWAKRNFWAKQRDAMGDVHRRAAEIFDRELERKEARKSEPSEPELAQVV